MAIHPTTKVVGFLPIIIVILYFQGLFCVENLDRNNYF